MRKKQLFVSKLAALTTVLLFLNLFTFVLAADAILQVCDNTPTVTAQLPVTNNTPPQQEAPRDPIPQPEPEVIPTEAQPGVAVVGKDKVWQERTRINVFHAWYDNETGEITVKSDNREKVVAPGTGSRYYFDICNTGNTGARYWLDANSGTTKIEYNGEIVEIPLEIKFYRQRGSFRYLVGRNDRWAPLYDLDGRKDQGTLSPGHYVRYTLDWQWPYEGDDILDTFLGDMAAEGEELRVWVEFTVYAEADDVEGGIPQTGDNSNIALWMGIFVCSGVLLIILLASTRKEKKDDK